MSTLEEIEDLIKQLYSSASTTEIDHVQKKLQVVQRSSGWQLADKLMRSSHQNVRFFAALTYTVKINQDGASLNEDDFNELLSTLLQWLILFISHGEGALVLKKLCSTLVTLFLIQNSSWKKCLRHVSCCLYSDTVVSEASIGIFPTTDDLVRNLNPLKKLIVLTITKDLAENASRIEHTSQHFNYCHERVELNLNDAVVIIGHALNSVPLDLIVHQTDVFDCYRFWISYTRQEFTQNSSQFKSLRMLLGAVGQCLFVHSTFEAAAEFFTDLFSADDNFFSADDAADFSRVFNTPWASEYLVKLEHGHESDEPIIFGDLLAAFAQAVTPYMVKSPVAYRSIIDRMHLVTRSQRFDTLDQGLSNALIDFWESFVSHAKDCELEAESNTSDFKSHDDDADTRRLHELAKTEWLYAMEELCIATILPMSEDADLKRLGSDHPFFEFRTRVQSAVHSSYTAFKHAVVEKLIALALNAHSRHQSHGNGWGEIDAIFNCLHGLSESMKYEVSNREAEDKVLYQLFHSPMYADLTNFTKYIPSRLRQKAINIMGEQDDFLGRHNLSLLNALEILFRGVEQPGLVGTASRAIFKLCNSNRTTLIAKILPFMEVSERFFVSKAALPASKKNVAAAIAAIIQALPSQADQAHAMGRLLSIIEQDFESTVAIFADSVGSHESDHLAKLSILEQLVAVGKASQTPDDVPFDVDMETDVYSPIWSEVQSRVVNLLGMLLNQSLHDGSIVQTIFDVLRTGYRETRPGPFVFEPHVSVKLIVTIRRETPRIDAAMTAAAALISAHVTRLSRIQPVLPTLLHWLCSIVTVELAIQDPELSTACLEFMNRLVPLHIAYISHMAPETVSTLFSFTLQCLNCGEILPKRSAATFWTSVLNMGSHTDSNFVERLIMSHGPALVTILIYGFGGDAARSQLDWLTEPFRKLVFHHGRLPWKAWTEEALAGDEFPSDRVSEADKRRFLKQVEQLRGEKRTNFVVREFWLACRGTPAGYG